MAAYQQGDRGEAIRIIQRALANAGFNPGAIDGVYGPKTAAAVRAAQAARGLPQSGVADHATQNAIGIGTPNDGGAPGGVTGEIAARLKRDYPQLAWALDVPGLAPIIARMNDMGAAEFQAAIYGSDFYKNNQASIRQGVAQRNVDPATWNASIEAQSIRIGNLAMQWGINDPAYVRQLAEQAIMLGWDDAHINQALAAHGGQWQGQEGQAGTLYTTQDQVLNLAKNTWGVPMSDTTAWEWSKRILAGSATLDGLNSLLQDQAKRMYPAIAKQIEEGTTVADYFSPFREMAAQELGINPGDISLADPKWNRAVVGYDDKGQRVPMSFDQWTRELRTNAQYGWDNTMSARNQAAQFATRALQQFGYQI